jgi:A/G-specific adenine glycosylase
MENLLPVKEKSIVNKDRWLYYFVVEHKGKVYVRKRETKDIWQNLYEFILYEHPKALTAAKLRSTSFLAKIIGTGAEVMNISGPYRQQLTHQTIHGLFISIKSSEPLQLPGYNAVNRSRLKSLPFPKFISSYLLEQAGIED